LSQKLKKIVKRVSDHFLATLNTYPEAVIADHRYGYIKSMMRQSVITYHQDRSRLHLSDQIDKVVGVHSKTCCSNPGGAGPTGQLNKKELKMNGAQYPFPLQRRLELPAPGWMDEFILPNS
jgi:hypothetical protein